MASHHQVPREEVEVSLREFGCPYGPLDPRTKPWLAGYRAGHASASASASRIMQEVFCK